MIQSSNAISKTDVSYYPFMFMDTSAISVIDLGDSFENYKVENERQRKSTPTGTERDYVFKQVLKQSRVVHKQTWAYESLDLVLGLVGGLAGVVWSVLSYLLGDYEQFKYQNSLIGKIYPTSPKVKDEEDDDEGNKISDERQARDAMLRIVAERGKYFYNYSEYLCAGALRYCSCCCKNKPWYKRHMEKLKRHDAASEKLSEEIDIIKFIYVLRVGQFISKLILNKSQRALVTSFKKYQIDDLGLANKTKGTIPGEQSDALLTTGI